MTKTRPGNLSGRFQSSGITVRACILVVRLLARGVELVMDGHKIAYFGNFSCIETWLEIIQNKMAAKKESVCRAIDRRGRVLGFFIVE